MRRGNQQHRQHHDTGLFLAAALFLAAHSALANETPRLLRVDVKGGYLEIDSRYEVKQNTSPLTGSISYDNTRLDIRPKVHVDLTGSVYHSNLLDYYLSIELGQSIEYEKLIQPSASEPVQERSDKNPLQFYDGQATVLKNKTLHGSVFGHYNLIRLDNGFFSRRLVYQTGYGATLDFAGDTLPWSVTGSHKEEEETDTRTPRDSMEDELNFEISNSRGDRGQSSLNYLYQDFERQDFNIPLYTGIRNYLRFNDLSHFLDQKLHLGSYLFYNDVDSTSIPSTTLTLRERLSADHTPDLTSGYEYSYGYRDTGSTKSITQTGQISLHHQLYESLSSTVSSDLRDINDTAIDTFRYGFTLDEAYTKRIGEASILGLGAVLSRHAEERESKEGDTVLINNEPHILTTGQPTYLNQPNVIAPSIEVRDPSGTTIYSEFIDYLVIQRGSITEIQRVVTGSIPNGGGVLVTYRIINPGSGSFTTEQNNFRFRYSLADQLLSFYGHLRIIEHDGADHFVLEDLNEAVIGVESTWNWLTVGAEYEDYDSSLLPTETFRLFEHISFPLSWRSTLRLSAEQSWVGYPETDEAVRRFYQNFAYRNQLTPKLSFVIDGAFHIERGENSISHYRDLLAVNTELNYRVGKTLFSATYEYLQDEYLNEERLRETAYLRVRRNF